VSNDPNPNIYVGRYVYRGDIWGEQGIVLEVQTIGGTKWAQVRWEDQTVIWELAAKLYAPTR
jgi:hypothetical protein